MAEIVTSQGYRVEVYPFTNEGETNEGEAYTEHILKFVLVEKHQDHEFEIYPQELADLFARESIVLPEPKFVYRYLDNGDTILMADDQMNSLLPLEVVAMGDSLFLAKDSRGMEDAYQISQFHGAIVQKPNETRYRMIGNEDD